MLLQKCISKSRITTSQEQNGNEPIIDKYIGSTTGSIGGTVSCMKGSDTTNILHVFFSLSNAHFLPNFNRTNSADGSVVSLSAFAYIYSELVQYHQQRAASISELERRLESAGYGVGLKVLEMTAYRAKEVSGRSCLS
jgi:hypothetical protein